VDDLPDRPVLQPRRGRETLAESRIRTREERPHALEEARQVARDATLLDDRALPDPRLSVLRFLGLGHDRRRTRDSVGIRARDHLVEPLEDLHAGDRARLDREGAVEVGPREVPRQRARLAEPAGGEQGLGQVEPRIGAGRRRLPAGQRPRA
jgi:hypothetical protein